MVLVVAMEVMKMVVAKKMTVKEEVCGGGTKRCKTGEKQCQSWLVTENLKIEHWPAECRCTAPPPRPRVWPIKIKLNKRVVVGQ